MLGLCGTLITGYLIPYIKKNLDAKALDNIQFWAGIAVQAAEGIWLIQAESLIPLWGAP